MDRPTAQELRQRVDDQCRQCRDEQNRQNAIGNQSARHMDEAAHALLNRLRRTPAEIDPEGRFSSGREQSSLPKRS